MRSCLLTLTPAGLTLLAAAMPVWERTHAEAEGGEPLDVNRLRGASRSISG